MVTFDHEYFMKMALRQAEAAFEQDEIPVGAVLVIQNKIIAKAHNQTELLNDCTAHAEMLALTSAFASLGTKYLPEATLYVTLEPCPMCAGALYWSKIERVVYGGSDPKNGYSRCCNGTTVFHPKTDIITGVLEDECTGLMKQFFKNKR